MKKAKVFWPWLQTNNKMSTDHCVIYESVMYQQIISEQFWFYAYFPWLFVSKLAFSTDFFISTKVRDDQSGDPYLCDKWGKKISDQVLLEKSSIKLSKKIEKKRRFEAK